MKTTIIVLVVVIVVVAGYFVFRPHTAVAPEITPTAMLSPLPTPLVTPTATVTKPTPSPTPTPGLQVHVSKIFKVSIQNFSFTPATVTVTKGDVVVFTNNDQVTHTVTSDTGAFTAGTVSPKSEFTVATANLAPGTYAYHCAIHTTMHGTIIVQ